MTVRQDGNRNRLVCDQCRYPTAPYPREAFQAMVDDARAAGWIIRRLDGGAYGHTCFSCAAARQTAKQPTQRGMF